MATFPWARGPTANGRAANRPAAASPSPPAWAACRPRRRDALAAVDHDRTVVRGFRQNKTRVAVAAPQTLASFSPSPFLSPRDAAATRASMAAGEKRGRRRRRPPRRRARSARARARRRRAAWWWCPKPSRARARAPGVPNGEGCLLWSARLARAALIRPAQVRPWVTHRPSKSGVPFPLGLGLGFRLFFSFSICIELLFLCLDSLIRDRIYTSHLDLHLV